MSLFDLSALQKLAQDEIDERNQREDRGDRMKMVYIGMPGKFRVKLLYNPKSGLLQRRIVRHQVGKNKIPCLSMYGEDCPICKAIHDAEELYGRDCGAWRTYGSKSRGISYAVLMGHDKKLFTEDNDPTIGDTILLQYPLSMYNEINDLIVDAGEFLESVVASNTGKTVELERTGGGSQGPMSYKANVYAFGDEKVKATDDEFKDLLENLPNLNEELVPSMLTSEILEQARAAAETITAEYAGQAVINPNNPPATVATPSETGTPVVTSAPESTTAAPIAPQPQTINTAESAPAAAGNKPECFGCYNENDNKCLLCPFDIDCITSSN